MAVVLGKAIPVKNQIASEGLRRLRLPGLSDSWHMKVAQLSSLCTGHLYLPGYFY
jgi:hypothetical protein